MPLFSQKKQRAGFALVVALSLMAMMVLLMVSLTTMVQVELAGATHKRGEEVARMNAILGMQIALGQLRQHAGPDQRITAPATTHYPNDRTTPTFEAIFKDNAEDRFGFQSYLTHAQREVFDENIKDWWHNAGDSRNPHWIGVWQSKREFGEHQRDQLPVWLVSGNENHVLDAGATEYPTGYLTPDMTLSEMEALHGNNSWVYVVDEGSAVVRDDAPDGLDGRVPVLKQPVYNGDSMPNGNYAYWVTDESLKANFTVRDPYYDVTDLTSKEYRNRLQSPQRVGWENIGGFAEVAAADDGLDPNDPRLDMLTSSDQIKLLDKKGRLVEPVRKNFHHLTAYSNSLLTDVVRGGFKKDLTVYFEKGEGATNGYISDNHPIPDPDGSDVFDYANDARLGDHNSGFPVSDNHIPTWGMLREWYENEGTDVDDVEISEKFSPMLTYFRLHYGFSFDEAKGEIHMHLLPVVVLWNPYDAPLKDTSYELRVQFNLPFRDFKVATPLEDMGESSDTGGSVMAPKHADYFLHELIPLDGVTAYPADFEDGYKFEPWPLGSGEIVMRISTNFQPGESLIFSVGGTADNDFAATRTADGVAFPLINDFADSQPPSVTFPLFRVVNPPSNPENMRFNTSMQRSPDGDGRFSQEHYQVTLNEAGVSDPLFYAEEFGKLNNNIFRNEANSGGGDPEDWRHLYTHDTVDSDFRFNIEEGSGRSRPESPLISVAQVYFSPFATAHEDLNIEYNDRKFYTARYYRSAATHNLFASEASEHPLVDKGRTQDTQNNGDGFSVMVYGIASTGGLRWFNQLAVPPDREEYDATRLRGTSLLHYRYSGKTATDDNGNAKKRIFGTLGQPFLPMRLVKRPEAELVSLGQLQQVNLSPYPWQPAFPIGNSEASPYVERAAMAGIESFEFYARGMGAGKNLSTVPNDVNNTMVDLSYLLNDSLWDHYFLSTIPQSGKIDLSAQPDWPNTRHRPISRVADPDDLRDFDRAAENLYNVGALNVNSTSVEAWKSLLTAFRDLHIEGEGQQNPEDTVPVSRTLSPLDEPVAFTFDESETDPDDFGAIRDARDYSQLFSGFRYLTDEMVQSLAERIVDEVRMRGPFLSLSDFVNRRLVSPDRSTDAWHDSMTKASGGGRIGEDYDPYVGLTGLNGTLQRAINLSGINGGMNYSGNLSSETRTYDSAFAVWPEVPRTGNRVPWENSTRAHLSMDAALNHYLDMEHMAGAPAGEFGQLMSHLPGFVTQGDLLSMIGPALTARGDTFLIRSYGDYVNPLTGETEAKALLETVVQRTGEAVDVNDASKGRKFQIISMRWLHPEDV